MSKSGDPKKQMSDRELIRQAAREARAVQARNAGIASPADARIRYEVEQQREARRQRRTAS